MHLITGRDAEVAAWVFERTNCQPMHIDLAIGIAGDSGELIGAFMFTAYNGRDAEVHFYGPGTLRMRVFRSIFAVAIRTLGLDRMTIRTRKPSMARGVEKLGAVYEGMVRRLYGPTDSDEHAGRQYAFFRERMMKLAKFEES